MNSRLRWRSLTRAWTLPVSRSIPRCSRLSRAMALVFVITREGRVDAMGTQGGKSGDVVAMAWIPGFSS